MNAMLSPQISWCDQDGTLCPPQRCALQPRACHSYGYGWFLYSQPNRSGDDDRVIEHSGSITGFGALSRYNPDQHLHLIILMNMDALSPQHVLRTLWDAATTS